MVRNVICLDACHEVGWHKTGVFSLVSIVTCMRNEVIYHCAEKPLSTTMLAASKNVLFPGHNHLLTTGLFTSWRSGDDQCRVISTGGQLVVIT